MYFHVAGLFIFFVVLNRSTNIQNLRASCKIFLGVSRIAYRALERTGNVLQTTSKTFVGNFPV